MTDISTQAADWLVRLTEEDPAPTAQDFAAFERWQQADPRHRQAVESLRGMMGALDAVPKKAARAALDAGKTDPSQGDWQSLAKTLSLVVLLVLPLYWLYSTQTIAVWLADKRTDHQTWQAWTLADGSTLQLSGNSAVDIEFDPEHRRLVVLRGSVLVDVARDVDRPLEVVSDHGRFIALGTRFVVEKHKDQTILTVLESTVAVRPTDARPEDAEIKLAAGEQIAITDHRVGGIVKLDAAKFERNWQAGQLVVDGKPLPTVLAALSHYHTGHLLYDADALETIEVMAVLPLQDPARALQLLSESLPITVDHYGPVLHISRSDH